MKNPLVHLKEMRIELSPSEQNVCDYILCYADEVSKMSIHELARVAYSSPSTIIRTVKKIGATGYSDFKRELITELAAESKEFQKENTDIGSNETTEDIINKVTAISMNALADTHKLMEPEVLDECINLIIRSKRVLLFGIGASYSSAKDIYMKFLRVNKPCFINEDWHLQLLTARNSTKDDVAIVFSYSGRTKEMCECVEEMKRHHTPIISITRCVPSTISELADYNLFTTSQEPIVRTGVIASRISQQYITDILYSTYVSRQYERCIQQFNRTHIEK